MAIKDLLKNVMDGIKRRKEEAKNEPDRDDDKTEDKYLRSLRRERRRQLEEFEKKRLKIEIAEHRKENMRRNLYGFKDRIEHEHRPTSLTRCNILRGGRR